MNPTNVKSCEYSVDIHGLQINKQYSWKVVVGDSWSLNWGCFGRDGVNCQFTTTTSSIRLKIVASFSYPLTADIIGDSSKSSTTTNPLSSSNSPKKVFAHYMVGFSYSSDQTFFDSQIKRAKYAGIDGFALNVGIDDWQPARVSKAFDAARNNGDFVMFISFDMSSLEFNNDALSRFHSFANHSNYYKIDGRPFYSTFGGENNDNFWLNWKSSSGLNPYFCPSWPNYKTAGLLESHSVADCIFTWHTWPANNSRPGAQFDTTGDKNLLASARASGKKYMAPISPWFSTYVWGSNWKKH